jgi:predicted metal-dependent hydrolase
MNTKNYNFTVSGIEVDVVQKDIKNIHLAVYPPTGRVRVSSPISTKKESLRLLVISKLGWIRKHIINMENQVREPKRKYIQGESHWFAGKRYLLNIIEDSPVTKVELRNKRYLDIYTNKKDDMLRREQITEDFYRSQLKLQIPDLISKWEKKLDVKVEFCGVRKMKSKWGSCNPDTKRIWLNLELGKKPTHCLEYIVLHEMIHLLERHHNARFRAMLDNYMPNWRSIKHELNAVVLEIE